MKKIVIAMDEDGDHISRELILERDDFQYLFSRIMHYRHIACQKEAEAVKGLYIFETAKTIATVASVLNEIPNIGFYKLYLVIDRINHESYLTTGIRYVDDYHTSDNDCTLTISYKTEDDWQGYRIELSRGSKVLDHSEYALFSEIADISRINPDKYAIYGYDMNFPMPSVFRRRFSKRFDLSNPCAQ